MQDSVPPLDLILLPGVAFDHKSNRVSLLIPLSNTDEAVGEG
jgi:hypothetical protein